MAIRSALWTEHNFYSLENQAESTVPCGTNGSVINLFRPAIHGDVPVKLPAPILLMENAPILILTRISEILPAFPEIQNIGRIFTDTELLQSAPSICSKMLLVLTI